MTARPRCIQIRLCNLGPRIHLRIHYCTHIEEPSSEKSADALDDDVEDGLDEADLAPDEQTGRHRGVDVATWSGIQG